MNTIKSKQGQLSKKLTKVHLNNFPSISKELQDDISLKDFLIEYFLASCVYLAGLTRSIASIQGIDKSIPANIFLAIYSQMLSYDDREETKH